jgi:hypothetical protein
MDATAGQKTETRKMERLIDTRLVCIVESKLARILKYHRDLLYIMQYVYFEISLIIKPMGLTTIAQ